MNEGSIWEVPQGLYHPLLQEAILLKDGETARAFFDFVKSDESRELIREHGYEENS